eukprot:gene30417-35422_t
MHRVRAGMRSPCGPSLNRAVALRAPRASALFKSPSVLHSMPRVSCKASSDDRDPTSSIEDLFSKELKKRGMSIDEGDNSRSATASPPQSAAPAPPKPVEPVVAKKSPAMPPPKNPFSGQPDGGPTPRSRSPPPISYANIEPVSANGGQRDKSMALVSEGLEGLIPRATELIKLGGSFFLAFAPLLVAAILTFGGVYAVFGESFIHGGQANRGPTPYMDPYELLSEVPPAMDSLGANAGDSNKDEFVLRSVQLTPLSITPSSPEMLTHRIASCSSVAASCMRARPATMRPVPSARSSMRTSRMQLVVTKCSAATEVTPAATELTPKEIAFAKRDKEIEMYHQSASYLKTMGFTNQAELSRVLDVATNPDSLFVTSEGMKMRNVNARPLGVETDLRPIVSFLEAKGVTTSEIVQLISGHPPVLSYSIDRLEDMWEYLNSLGVTNVQGCVTSRPSILGLDVNQNLKKIVA